MFGQNLLSLTFSKKIYDLFIGTKRIPLVDQSISSLTRRFKQFKVIRKNGFLFTSIKLRSLDSNSWNLLVLILRLPLKRINRIKKSDIDANNLFCRSSWSFFKDLMPKEIIGHVGILKFLKHHDFFPIQILNIEFCWSLHWLFHRQDAEQNLPKMKLLKSYMCSN